MKKLTVKTFMLAAALVLTPAAFADNYKIDTEGAHAFIQFKIKHLGYSWLVGRFNTFDGQFSYDDKHPSNAKIDVMIDTTSIDSNHAERDKHLRSKDFLDTGKFPKAKFVSESFKETSKGNGKLSGKFTLHGVTKPITIDVTYIGEGKDPWGGYRLGFEGNTTLVLADFGINGPGPASTEVELYLGVEGIRQ